MRVQSVNYNIKLDIELGSSKSLRQGNTNIAESCFIVQRLLQFVLRLQQCYCQ
jgi:hypothetical protein